MSMFGKSQNPAHNREDHHYGLGLAKAKDIEALLMEIK